MMGEQKLVGYKHIPYRTCVACRKSLPKRQLIRVSCDSQNHEIQIDVSGKGAGRGCYLCTSEECWTKAVKSNIIDIALRIKLHNNDRVRLRDYFENVLATNT